jgi:hypothetical protein
MPHKDYKDYYQILKALKHSDKPLGRQDLILRLEDDPERDRSHTFDRCISGLWKQGIITRARTYPRRYQIVEYFRGKEFSRKTLNEIMSKARKPLNLPRDFSASIFCVLEEVRLSDGITAPDIASVLGLQDRSARSIFSVCKRWNLIYRRDELRPATYYWTGIVSDSIEGAQKIISPRDQLMRTGSVPQGRIEKTPIVGTIPPIQFQKAAHRLETLDSMPKQKQIEILRRYMRLLGYTPPRDVLNCIRKKELVSPEGAARGETPETSSLETPKNPF